MKNSRDREVRRIYYMLQNLDPSAQIGMFAAITRQNGGQRTLNEFTGLVKKAIKGDRDSQDQVMGMVYAGVAGLAAEHLLPVVTEGLGWKGGGAKFGVRGEPADPTGLRPSARVEKAARGGGKGAGESVGISDVFLGSGKVQSYIDRASSLMTKYGREKGFRAFVEEVRREHGFSDPLPEGSPADTAVETLIREKNLSQQEVAKLRMEAQAAANEGARVKPIFDRKLDQIAQSLGAKTKHGPIKSPDRILQKALSTYDGNIGQVKDVVRSTIIAPDYASVPRIVAEIKRSMRATFEQDRFAEPTSTGFRDYFMQVKLPNGRIGEIQVHIPEMYGIKDGLSHDLYEMMSTLKLRKENSVVNVFNKMANKIHGDAWKRSQAKSSGRG